MKVAAIILSAGKGKRMNSRISKQYMLIKNKPLLYYTLMAFQNSSVDDIVIVADENDMIYIQDDIIDKYGITKVSKVVRGGKERYNSSYNGILAAENADYVLIHDAARPCITSGKINELIDSVETFKACILGVPVKDTIKISDNESNVVSTPERNYLWQIQTPQAFERQGILDAYNRMFSGCDEPVTDDSMVVERFSDKKVHILNGEYTNIKVTTPEDMRFVKELIN